MRDDSFRKNHSGDDRLLDGHKYQGALLSYHGVPIVDDKGEYSARCATSTRSSANCP